MQLLVLKISDLDKNPEYALLSKKQLQDKYTSGDWARVRSLARGKKVVVLLPADDVVLTSVMIPSKNRKQLLQAVPFALEDTLAEDIDNLHFAIHQTNNNKTEVAIINRFTLNKVLDTLRIHGLTTSFVLPQVLAQKFENETWSIALEDQHEGEKTANIRLDKYNGFSCDEGLLGLFLDEAIEEKSPQKVYTNISKKQLPESLQASAIEYLDVERADYNSVTSALALNLLNNFVRSGQSSNINWKAWRPVAILGGVVASIWIGIFFWQNNVLQQQSQQLDQQIKQVFKDTFPNSRIVNASAQMQNELKKLKSNTGLVIESPLPLIASIGPLLKTFNDLVFSEIRYQENNLSLIIEASSHSRLEKFKEAAADANLHIEIKDPATTADKVKATIIVSPLENTKKQSEKNT